MRYKPKTKPFKHQSQAVIRAVRARNYAIFFEPRLGKTKAALDYSGIMALKYHDEGERFRVLVLAPKIALSVWEDEIPKHFPLEHSVETFDWYDGDGETLQFFLAGREQTMRATRKAGTLYRPKQDELEAWDPDIIIVDESHEYKRPGGRGAQDLWRMVRRLRKRRTDGRPYVLLLSGTPNPKGWRDLFAQFRIMDDRIFGTSAQEFDEEYVKYGHGSRRYSIVGYNREAELRAIVRRHSISVAAEQAGLAGRQSWQSIRVSLPEKARRIYTDLATEMLAEWEGGEIDAANAGVKRLRLLQLTGGFVPGHEGPVHREKLQAASGYLELLMEQRESVVVYARFLPEVDGCAAVAEKVGFDTAVIQGSTPHSDRLRAIRSFQSVVGSKKPKALVFQIQTGKQSIELSAAAEVLYYSTPDGWVDYWQSLNRVRGPNQTRPVRYTHILARNTVDLATLEGLRRKEEWHQTLMRNPKRYLMGF